MKSPRPIDDELRAETARDIEDSMRSFEAAERSLDAERLISHFADVPEFHMHSDGERISFAAMAAGVRSGFHTLSTIEGGFADVQVFVLAPDAGVATATFREVLTDRNGTVVRRRGAASWLWRRIDGTWRIVYGHVDHHLDDSG